MNKKDCNCKAKKDVNKLIKNIEDINKSSSRNHVSKNNSAFKIIFLILKVLIYMVLSLLMVLLIIPGLIYMIITKKNIKIKLFSKNAKQ